MCLTSHTSGKIHDNAPQWKAWTMKNLALSLSQSTPSQMKQIYFNLWPWIKADTLGPQAGKGHWCVSEGEGVWVPKVAKKKNRLILYTISLSVISQFISHRYAFRLKFSLCLFSTSSDVVIFTKFHVILWICLAGMSNFYRKGSYWRYHWFLLIHFCSSQLFIFCSFPSARCFSLLCSNFLANLPLRTLPRPSDLISDNMRTLY